MVGGAQPSPEHRGRRRDRESPRARRFSICTVQRQRPRAGLDPRPPACCGRPYSGRRTSRLLTSVERKFLQLRRAGVETMFPFAKDSLSRFVFGCSGAVIVLWLLWVGMRNPLTESADRIYFLSAIGVGVLAFFLRF